MVKTEPIVLEEVELGPFAIELHISCLAEHTDSSCFDCVALEPNCPASGEEVTRPNVRKKALCAGDAAVLLSAALRESRICDAFCLMALEARLQDYPEAPAHCHIFSGAYLPYAGLFIIC